MADLICYKCGDEIGDECFECDGCTLAYHLPCAGVTKQEYKTREKSERMRLMCDDCSLNDPLSNVIKNTLTMMKFIYENDAQTQNIILSNTKMEKNS